MARMERRIQMRIFAEDESVSDDAALIETRLVRHMNKLEGMSRDNLKNWIMTALRNQYLIDSGHTGGGASQHAPEPVVERALNDEGIDEAIGEVGTSAWDVDETSYNMAMM